MLSTPCRHIFVRALMASIVALAVPLSASGQDSAAQAEVESVLADYWAAENRMDTDGMRKHLAKEFTLRSYNCGTGKDDLKSRQKMLEQIRQVASLNAAYDKQPSGRSISFLGGGPIAVVRQTVTETIRFDTGSLSLRATEAYYLAKIGGSYKITSGSTRTVCETVKMTGTIPSVP